jgi:hypothetical protein
MRNRARQMLAMGILGGGGAAPVNLITNGGFDSATGWGGNITPGQWEIGGDAASLWIANSLHGRVWSVPSPALLAQSGSDPWDKYIYRATALKTASGFDIWYSARNTANEWHIGFTQAA